MLHQEGLTVVFQHATRQDVRIVIEALRQLHTDVNILWCKAQEEADCTDQIDNDLDGLDNALNNVLADFETDGYEREEAPRYARWLDTGEEL